MTIITHYTTTGPVRGTCGHAHKSMETAARCAYRDGRACKSVGGYSDRRVRAVRNDGQWLHLDGDAADIAIEIISGARS